MMAAIESGPGLVQEHNESDQNREESEGKRIAWKRVVSSKTFQLLLLSSLTRLFIYLNKLFQDFNAVSTYYTDSDLNFALISVASLILPPLVYVVFLTGTSLVKQVEVDPKDISTKTVNGLLLIPWQIKRHLDVLYFAAQRVCYCRVPDKEEKENMLWMEREAEVLEFFEDFYAAIIQIMLQIYILLGVIQHNWGSQTLKGEAIGSALSILSMMLSIRRRDDGILTSALSFLGWVSFIVSRLILFSLIASYIHSWLILVLALHSALFTFWVYNIAIASHSLPSQPVDLPETVKYQTRRQRISLCLLVLCFFGIPSLFYWPIMFQLKDHMRPFKYLVIAGLENVILLSVYAILRGNSGLVGIQANLCITVIVTTVVSILFLSTYIFCKPKYTDQVVFHEMRAENKESYGVYYEFCDIVFKLPSLSKNLVHDLHQIRRGEGNSFISDPLSID